MERRRSMLDRLRVAKACDESWEQMRGTNQVRFCSHCEKSVHNLSAMTRRDAERLVAASGGRLCIRYISTPARRVVTLDAPPLAAHALVRRASRFTAGAFTAALAMTTASAQTTQTSPPPAMIAEAQVAKPDAPQLPCGSASLTGTITDQIGAVIPGATVKLTDMKGAIRSARTSGDGSYRIDDLPAGTFTFDVDAQGFGKLEATHVSLSGGIEQKFDAVLDIDGEVVVMGEVMIAPPLL